MDGDTVIQMCCKHIFHDACLRRWFTVRTREMCPLRCQQGSNHSPATSNRSQRPPPPSRSGVAPSGSEGVALQLTASLDMPAQLPPRSVRVAGPVISWPTTPSSEEPSWLEPGAMVVEAQHGQAMATRLPEVADLNEATLRTAALQSPQSPPWEPWGPWIGRTTPQLSTVDLRDSCCTIAGALAPGSGLHVFPAMKEV